MRRSRSVILALSICFAMAASPADAVTTAASADDICAPAEDPCVIDSAYDVTGPLAFGARTVRIVTGGKLRGQPGVNLGAGMIEIAVGSTSANIIESDGTAGGSIDIGATRSCSGDGLTACMVHAQCAGLGLGTCTAGNSGTVVLGGIISAAGSNPGSVSIVAAGDITVARRVSASATFAAVDSGEIWVESYQGSVNIAGPLAADAASGTYDYSTGYSSGITILAAVDVTLGAEVSSWAPEGGGRLEVSAGRDVVLNADIRADSGKGVYATGGYVTLASGRDVKALNATGGDPVQEIDTDGGGAFYFSGYGGYGWWQSGYGGHQYLKAGEDLYLGPNSNLHSHGGPGARGGYIDLDAYDGDATIHGTVAAQGKLPIRGGDSSAGGGDIDVRAATGIRLGAGGKLDTGSPFGLGSVRLHADGPIELEGTIDVRGTADGHYIYSNPGYVGIDGNTDVTISGRIRGGGNDRYGWDDWRIDVCRLHLTPTAVLDQASNFSNPWQLGLRISIGESMVADPKSSIETDAGGGTKTFISYRDPKKPPLLSGVITPAALVQANPSLPGCPVCGNLEIDEGESCDDGNTTSGDGCRSDCQDEGCVAATPGFPAVPICDDGAECTADECDPVAHVCRHPVSCEDGVACTVDTCSNGACLHVPDDTACDDHNDCSDDLCNETTGCVYADLSGNSCEDGDLCTMPGICDSGTCETTPGLRSTGNSIKTKVYDAAGDDRLRARMEVPLASFTADPATSGARLMLSDENDVVIYDTELPVAGWRRANTLRWSYRSESGAVIRATVKVNEKREVVRIGLRAQGADLEGAANQTRLSLSLLFGADVATDPCLTARSIPCVVRGASTICTD